MSPPAPALLLPALARLLRPLVRLLIGCGITFPMLVDLLRGLYVNVAQQDLLPDPHTRTDSRVSLMTGVHRKELRRQRTPEPAAETPSLTIGSRVAARWLALPELADLDGGPRPLPRTAPPDRPSFESLVAAVTRDVRPRAVLDDWLDQGVATLDADGMVRLRAEAFLPRPGGAEQLFYFARNLHDHMAAAAANLGADMPPFLDRSVHYDRLSPAAAARLRAVARDAAQRMLLEVNRQALAIADADDAAGPHPGPAERVNLGAYLYSDAEH